MVNVEESTRYKWFDIEQLGCNILFLQSVNVFCLLPLKICRP